LGDSFQTTLQAARQAAPWAWTLIYKELAPALTGYLRASGSVDPEDLTAEVFLRVVQDIGRFEGDEAKFRSWVFVIAHHRLIDDRRRRIRRPQVSLNLESLRNFRFHGDSETEAMNNLSTDSVEAIIRRCAPDQKEVLLLRVVAGLTLAETAEVLGKGLSAVKALQRRGVATIRRAIAEEAVTL
jgi:RNA polymerase sigma-70 factor (ECF subfamily)